MLDIRYPSFQRFYCITQLPCHGDKTLDTYNLKKRFNLLLSVVTWLQGRSLVAEVPGRAKQLQSSLWGADREGVLGTQGPRPRSSRDPASLELELHPTHHSYTLMFDDRAKASRSCAVCSRALPSSIQCRSPSTWEAASLPALWSPSRISSLSSISCPSAPPAKLILRRHYRITCSFLIVSAQHQFFCQRFPIVTLKDSSGKTHKHDIAL